MAFKKIIFTLFFLLGLCSIVQARVRPIRGPVLDSIYAAQGRFGTEFADSAGVIADNSIDSTKIIAAGVSLTDIAQSSATSGQVIKWSGSAWAPAADGGGSGGVWGDTIGIPDTVYFKDSDGDTTLVVSDNDAGTVEWDIGPQQSYLIIGSGTDSVSIGSAGGPTIIRTSLQIPHGTDPTVDELGEIAQDSDGPGFKVYDTIYNTSMYIPFIQSIQIPISDADVINDTMPIYHFDAIQWPGGVEIVQIAFANYVAPGDTIILEEWSDEVGTAVSRIDSLILTSGTRVEIAKGSIEDTDIATDAWIYGIFTMANAPSGHITIHFYGKPVD